MNFTIFIIMVLSILRSSHLVLYTWLSGLAFAVDAILIRSSNHSWNSTEWENPSRTKEGREKRWWTLLPFLSPGGTGQSVAKAICITNRMLVTDGYKRVSKTEGSMEIRVGNNLWKIQISLLIDEYVKTSYIRHCYSKK